MNREKMYNKYAATLAKMAEKEAGDTSVLFDKLVYMAKNGGKEGAVFIRKHVE